MSRLDITLLKNKMKNMNNFITKAPYWNPVDARPLMKPEAILAEEQFRVENVENWCQNVQISFQSHNKTGMIPKMGLGAWKVFSDWESKTVCTFTLIYTTYWAELCLRVRLGELSCLKTKFHFVPKWYLQKWTLNWRISDEIWYEASLDSSKCMNQAANLRKNPYFYLTETSTGEATRHRWLNKKYSTKCISRK